MAVVDRDSAAEGEDFIVEVREKFERAAEKEQDNRTRAEGDIRFARLGEQWPDKLKKQREDDLRPVLTINRMPTFIRQVVNEARQNRPAITVIPADSNADPETAEMMSGLIRNIEVSSDADIAYDTAVEGAVSGGFGYFRINTAYAGEDAFEQDIVIERIADPLTVYGDPDSDSADGSDWNCCFIVSTMTKDAFEDRFKGKDAVDWDDLGYTKLRAPWMDGDNVMVAEYWHREDVADTVYQLGDGSVVDRSALETSGLPLEVVGQREVTRKKVTQYLVSGAEVLETVEWAGKYIPIVPVYGDEIIVNGERHLKSLIHDAIDAQREHNFWRSAAAEMVALAPKTPFIGPTGAFNTDIQKWSTANNASHPFIEYDGPVAPARQPGAMQPIAEMQQAMNAADDMKSIIGIFDASLGNRSNETSGVAIRARQRQGDVATFHFLDNLTRSIRHAGRIILNLIPKVYSSQRIVRILGQDMKPANAQIAPQQQHAEMQQQAAMQGQAIGRLYDLTAGKYDLVVKAGPAFGTQREEARAEIVEVVRAYPAAAPVLGPMYLRNSDWPGADDAADKLEAMSGGQQDNGAQAQLSQMQQQMMQLQAENQALKQANQIKAFEAETKRMEAQVKAQEVSMKGQIALVEASQPRAAMEPPSNPYGLG